MKAKKGKCKRVYKKIVHHNGRRRMSRQFDSTDFLKMERKKLRTGRSKIGPKDVRKLTTLMEEISCKLDGSHGAKEDTFTHLEEYSAKSIVSSASCSKKAKGERTVKTLLRKLKSYVTLALELGINIV